MILFVYYFSGIEESLALLENVNTSDYFVTGLIYFNLTSMTPYNSILLDISKVNKLLKLLLLFLGQLQRLGYCYKKLAINL